MKSMTGYGSAKKSLASMDIEVGIKTVNGRFFDFKPHMPREFSELEGALKKTLQEIISRGTVDIYVNRKYKATSHHVKVTSNHSLAKAWMAEYQKLAKGVGASDTIDLAQVLAHCPEIMATEEVSSLNTEVKGALIEVVKKAALACDRERAREGKALKKELLRLLAELQNITTNMKSLRAEALKALHTRYQDRIEKLGAAELVEPQRLAQEVAIQIDKTDIQEEMARLAEHIKSLKQLIGTDGPKGKKLDFYTQELLRETNTIGSKSQLAELTDQVVQAKSIVEQFREQVQNIE